MMVFIFKPANVPSAAVFMDYPEISPANMRFINTYEDLQQLHGHNKSKYIIHAEGPEDQRILSAIDHFKSTNRLELYAQSIS